jgi:transposase
MNLHANAALSLNRRRLLCERVVDETWTVTKAAKAAEVSVRCARKWVGRYSLEVLSQERAHLSKQRAPVASRRANSLAVAPNRRGGVKTCEGRDR